MVESPEVDDDESSNAMSAREPNQKAGASEALLLLRTEGKEKTVEERKQQVQSKLDDLEAKREAERNPPCDFKLDLGIFDDLKKENANVEEEMQILQVCLLKRSQMLTLNCRT